MIDRGLFVWAVRGPSAAPCWPLCGEVGSALSAHAGMDTLFTIALDLKPTFVVEGVELDTAERRIDFRKGYAARTLTWPACVTAGQRINDRLERYRRHLDFLRYDSWLHCYVPRVSRSCCGKTTQSPVTWARADSVVNTGFDDLALALGPQLPVSQSAGPLGCTNKASWRQTAHHPDRARSPHCIAYALVADIDETNLHCGQSYISTDHDIQANRQLFATPGRDHSVVLDFVADLTARGGQRSRGEHMCIGISAGYTQRVRIELPCVQMSFHRFTLIVIAHEALDALLSSESRTYPPAVRGALVRSTYSKTIKQLLRRMRRNAENWGTSKIQTILWLRLSGLLSAGGWHLKMTLRQVFQHVPVHTDENAAKAALKVWVSWACRCRLRPFEDLAFMIIQRLDAVVYGMLDPRNNAYVEAMNAQMQMARRPTWGGIDQRSTSSISPKCE